MKKIFLFIVIISLPLLYGCKEVSIKYNDNGTTVNLVIDQILKIELPGDAASGNSWRKMAYDDNQLRKFGKSNYLLGDGGDGSPGVYYFRYKAIAAGTSKLYLEYGSKFDSDEAAIKKFEVTVIVHEKP